MTLTLPDGFQAAGVHCGIKRNPQKPDLMLLVCDQPTVAAGVYTQNRVCAAPVLLDRERTPSDNVRVLVVNSGNANACTGPQGDADARQMAHLAEQAAAADPQTALVMSTGIIGQTLPMEKIGSGIDAASRQLGTDEAALLAAADAILTTDLVRKIAHTQIEIEGEQVSIVGFAKGSGMIGPNMATMLGVLLTDARLSPELAQSTLQSVSDASFNCITVDGHTSTNDSVVLLASGASKCEISSPTAQETFRKALLEVSSQLAIAIASDGEGATHLITIDVQGCASTEAARTIAKAVADSPLVKTAVTGADPNWGRIISAAGYAGVPFDPAQVTLHLNDTLLYENGIPAIFDAERVSQSIRDHHETRILLSFQEGSEQARFWTCDLTKQYITINADYHT